MVAKYILRFIGTKGTQIVFYSNQYIEFQWHSLSREEQAKYYEQARKERQLHMQMYPGWSARDNYAQSKKKKRKRETETNGNEFLPFKPRGLFVFTAPFWPNPIIWCGLTSLDKSIFVGFLH